MRYHSNLLCIAIGLAVFATGCSSEIALVPDSDDVYIHAGSQIPFPPIQGDFVRTSVKEGEPDATGVTVDYRMAKLGETVTMQVTIYANPFPKPEVAEAASDGPPKSEAQTKQLEIIKADIIASGNDKEHRFIAAYDIAITQGELPVYGKRAFFRDRFNVFTNAYIFEFKDYFVEYRTVFARDLERVAEGFVTLHSWNVPPPVKEEK